MNTVKALPLSEYQICVQLVAYLDILVMQRKVLIYSHIPNSTYTKSWAVKMRNKKLGLQAGLFDYIIVLPDGVLFLEMKTEHKGVVSPAQKVWLEKLHQAGQRAYIAHGFTEAKEIIDSCLKNGN